jgi:hypothetical protein
MYERLQSRDKGGFASAYYWSSSEYNEDYAWSQYFGFGYQGVNDKVNYLQVRLVRDSLENDDPLVLSFDDKYFEVAEEDEMEMTWYEAIEIYGVIRENSGLAAMVADRDAWMKKAGYFFHLLSLVKDDIQDAHVFGLVKTALKERSQ